MEMTPEEQAVIDATGKWLREEIDVNALAAAYDALTKKEGEWTWRANMLLTNLYCDEDYVGNVLTGKLADKQLQAILSILNGEKVLVDAGSPPILSDPKPEEAKVPVDVVERVRDHECEIQYPEHIDILKEWITNHRHYRIRGKDGLPTACDASLDGIRWHQQIHGLALWERIVAPAPQSAPVEEPRFVIDTRGWLRVGERFYLANGPTISACGLDGIELARALNKEYGSPKDTGTLSADVVEEIRGTCMKACDDLIVMDRANAITKTRCSQVIKALDLDRFKAAEPEGVRFGASVFAPMGMEALSVRPFLPEIRKRFVGEPHNCNVHISPVKAKEGS